MTHVLHRTIGHDYPVAVSGNGVFIRDAAGKDYIDASGGAAVSCLGHSTPRCAPRCSAARQARLSRTPASSPPQAAEELADQLVAHAPADSATPIFCRGGSEAIEAALKLARQYFVERGEPSARHFIARRQSYHGNTLGALAIGGNAWRRELFAPLLIDAHHISPCL